MTQAAPVKQSQVRNPSSIPVNQKTRLWVLSDIRILSFNLHAYFEHYFTCVFWLLSVRHAYFDYYLSTMRILTTIYQPCVFWLLAINHAYFDYYLSDRSILNIIYLTWLYWILFDMRILTIIWHAYMIIYNIRILSIIWLAYFEYYIMTLCTNFQ